MPFRPSQDVEEEGLTDPFEGAPYQTAVELVGGNHHNPVSCFLEPAEDTGVNQEVNPKARGSEVSLTQSYLPIFSRVEILPLYQFPQVHPLIMTLFNNKIPNVPLAGRLVHFQNNWRKLTSDSTLLIDYVQGFQIPFKNNIEPDQYQKPRPIRMSQTEESLIVNKEISEMLKKGAIKKVASVQGQFLSTMFLVGKW